ncbi:MAG: hypothetical protein ACKO92_06245, partial [Actinomycetota bacterium]
CQFKFKRDVKPRARPKTIKANLSPQPYQRTSPYSGKVGSPHRQDIVKTTNVRPITETIDTDLSPRLTFKTRGTKKKPNMQTNSKTTTESRSAISDWFSDDKNSNELSLEVTKAWNLMKAVKASDVIITQRLTARPSCSAGLP